MIVYLYQEELRRQWSNIYTDLPAPSVDGYYRMSFFRNKDMYSNKYMMNTAGKSPQEYLMYLEELELNVQELP